mmetsp:Transcript_49946/g.87904  ORF Transcript_49946/g.87904 Transcript_49946/m.87904 type:complete len:412 (-) Transcript_49946:118-1353(-)
MAMVTQQNLRGELRQGGRAETNISTCHFGSCAGHTWEPNDAELGLLDQMRNFLRLLKLNMEGYQRANRTNNRWFQVLSILSIICATITPALESAMPMDSPDDIQRRRTIVIILGAVNALLVALNSLLGFQKAAEQHSVAACQYFALVNEYNARFGCEWSCYVRGAPVEGTFKKEFLEFRQHCKDQINELFRKTPLLSSNIRKQIEKIGKLEDDTHNDLLDKLLQNCPAKRWLRASGPSHNHKHDAVRSSLQPTRDFKLAAQEPKLNDAHGTGHECVASSDIGNDCYRNQPQVAVCPDAMGVPQGHAELSKVLQSSGMCTMPYSRPDVQLSDTSNSGGPVNIETPSAMEALGGNAPQLTSVNLGSSHGGTQFIAQCTAQKRQMNSLTPTQRECQRPCHGRLGVLQDLAAENV